MAALAENTAEKQNQALVRKTLAQAAVVPVATPNTPAALAALAFV